MLCYFIVSKILQRKGLIKMKNCERVFKFSVLTIMMILILGMLTGCNFGSKDNKTGSDDNANSFEEPIANVINGLTEANSGKFLGAFPDYIADYMKVSFTDDFLKTTVEAAEEQFGKNVSRTFKVVDKTDISEDDLREIEEEVKQSFDKEIKISKGYLVKVEITTKGDDSEETEVALFSVYEIDGKWFMLNL